MRRGLRSLSTVLIIAGAMLLLDAGLTIAWQEPVSAIYARITQNRLKGDLRNLGRAPVSPATARALRRLGRNPNARVAVLARDLRRTVHTGQAIGRIRIPRINASYVVVQGTDTASLRKGPGHYPATPFPGLHGTVAIAGHRTTYLAPFRHVDDLRPGDPITLDMPYANFTYRVTKIKIVSPNALYVTRPVGYDQLVLSACHPLYSASHRIVVFAKLRDTVPEGRARMGS
jgi:sortase A